MRDRKLRAALVEAQITLGVELDPYPYDQASGTLRKQLSQLEDKVNKLARSLGYDWINGGRWEKQ